MNVLNRFTKKFIPSVNEPDYPTNEWIHQPDLSSVSGLDPKYWKIVGDTVAPMSTSERADVDATEHATMVEAAGNLLNKNADYQVAFNLLVFDEINTLRVQAGLNPRTLAQLKAALKAKVAE